MLINAAGGNQSQATTTAEQTFFDLDLQAVDRVFGLNLLARSSVARCLVAAWPHAARAVSSMWPL